MRANQKVNDSIVADWKFSKENVKSGSLQNGNLVIEDASQNGNDLELVTVGDSSSPELEKIMKWSEDDYDNLANVDSIQFDNYKNAPAGRYFKTTNDAPINDGDI